jgi:hypothetical protein
MTPSHSPNLIRTAGQITRLTPITRVGGSDRLDNLGKLLEAEKEKER